MEKRAKREFTKEFKQQMVMLHSSGKPASEIIREYDLTASAFHKWVKQFRQTGSFKENENQTPGEKELIALRKQNKQLLMENDILKQAALIMGRK